MDNYTTFELDNQRIGERIYKLRTERHLSQEKFAEKTGIDNMKAISKFENGVQTLKLSQAAGIAKFCGVTVDWIIWGEEPTSISEVKNQLLRKVEQLQRLINTL